MRVLAATLAILAAGPTSIGQVSATPSTLDLRGARIVQAQSPHPLETLAARELQRYLRLLGAGQCSIGPAVPNRPSIRLGVATRPGFARAAIAGKNLGEEGSIAWVTPSTHTLSIAAGNPRGLLFGVYGLLARMGVGFSLGGDALAGAGPPAVPIDMNVVEKPVFRIRGSLPWYNFLDSPTTWDRDDFRYYCDQMARMRNNFIGFHSYDSEPFCAYPYRGKIEGGEPLVTAHNYGWGTVKGLATTEFGFGTGAFFNGPEFGAKPATMRGSRAARILASQRLLADGLRYAHARGLKTCVGFEVSGDPTLPENQKRLVARLHALLSAYPMLDYVWIWQSEGLGGGSAVADPGSQMSLLTERYTPNFAYLKEPTRIHEAVRVMLYSRLAHAILKKIAPNVRMVLSGWGGDRWMRFSDFYIGLDKLVPGDIVFSALDNIDPSIAPTVAEAYGKLAPARERWPIPWWESDGGYSRRDQWGPQCNAAPFEPLCRDSLAKGSQGMLAIHWRTRDVEEASAFEARFAWDPKLTNKRFFDGFAASCYGADVRDEMSAIHRELEALGPRYTGGYGQVECGGFEWFSGNILPKETNLERLGRLRSRIESVRARLATTRPAALERIDWLLLTIDWLVRYDHAAMVLRPGGEVDSAVAAAELARDAGDAAGAAEAARRASSAFQRCRLAEAIQTYPWKMTTCGEWGALATINVKAYAAYLQIAARLKAAGGDPGPLTVPMPMPPNPVVVMRTPPGIVQIGAPVPVEAVVVGTSPSVRLAYRAGGSGQWRYAPMARTWASTWTGAVPSIAVGAEGIEYRVEARGASSAWGGGYNGRPVPTFSATAVGLPTDTPAVRPAAARAQQPIRVTATCSPEYTVHLSWTGLSTGAAATITRTPGGKAPVTTQLTEYLDASVRAGQTFTYRVTGGGSSASIAVAVPVGPRPPAPANLVATPGAGKVRLTWEAVTTRVAGYRVYRYSSTDAQGVPLTELPITGTSYIDLRPDKAYTYRVATEDRGGQLSDYSLPAGAQALPRGSGPLFVWSASSAGPLPTGAAVQAPAKLGPNGLDTSRGGWMVVPHQPAFDIAGEFAVALRFRAHRVDQIPVIASCGEFQKSGWFVQILGNRVRFSLGGDAILDAGAMTPNQLHTVVCTYDGLTMRIAVDGAEVGSKEYRNVGTSNWSGPLFVGQYHFLEPQYQFWGEIARLSIYDYSPDMAEIQAISAAP